MKKLRFPALNSRNKKLACTVSAAALMLGVSSAATVGLHFQETYCGSTPYSGFPVTLTAFGIAPSGWENLIPMSTGYACPITSPPYSYTLNELIDSTTSANGLNPLPNGSLNVTWTANDANFSGFAGYGGKPPSYAYDGHPPVPMPTGEWQIYSTFLRDGVNFGITPSGAFDYTVCGDNDQPGYLVDITGLKSVFTNSPFVIELIAAADSMQTLTNAFVVDVTSSTTNSVAYPSTPTPYDEGGTCGQWLRGHGGGLSTATALLDTDHVQIMSAHPQHGGVGVPPTGFDHAGTISGFIITDKPVVSSPPQSLFAEPGDSVQFNPYAIGVPPLSYQWRFGGVPIPGATSSSYTVAYVTNSTIGNYDVVVANVYGATTSKVATISSETLSYSTGSEVVFDSNPLNPQRNGTDIGATWLASSSDGTTTLNGVMQFDATNANGISVPGATNLESPTGTITLWMRSAGTVTGQTGVGGSLFCEPSGASGTDFILYEQSGGFLVFQDLNGNANLETTGNISDNKWHFIALTFDNSAQGVASFYVDGALNATNASGNAWSWPPTLPKVEIGFTSDTTYGDYNGLLKDVRFYNANLSAAQIASIYSTGALANTNALQMRLDFAAPPGPGTVLSWPAPAGVLQSAPAVNGTYLDVPGVFSPYTIVPSATQQYFRYSYPPQPTTNLVSNPYLM